MVWPGKSGKLYSLGPLRPTMTARGGPTTTPQAVGMNPLDPPHFDLAFRKQNLEESWALNMCSDPSFLEGGGKFVTGPSSVCFCTCPPCQSTFPDLVQRQHPDGARLERGELRSPAPSPAWGQKQRQTELSLTVDSSLEEGKERGCWAQLGTPWLRVQ